jgi:class 3 adenylate cyclase
LHDTVQEQAVQLAEWNRTLEKSVKLIVTSGDEGFLESRRREIAVVFSDLRGFTAFSETGKPEEVMGLLRSLIFQCPGNRARIGARCGRFH